MKLLAAALGAGLLAVAFERRSLLLATLASAAGLAIAVGLIVFPETTWYGLPTMETLRAALDAGRDRGRAGADPGRARRAQRPPAPRRGGLALGRGVLGARAGVPRGSPLLGLIPPVALVAFADTVLEEFVKPLYGVAFLVAALLVIFADGLARIQGWGPCGPPRPAGLPRRPAAARDGSASRRSPRRSWRRS